MQDFTKKVIEVIAKVPMGKVATYGQVALLAGNPRAARQVSRILHSQTRKYNLPWHRIINGKGEISLPSGAGYEEQRELLMDEGVDFDHREKIDLDKYGWKS